MGIKESFPKQKLCLNTVTGKPVGGSKLMLEKESDINEVFLALIKEHAADDPMEETNKQQFRAYQSTIKKQQLTTE